MNIAVSSSENKAASDEKSWLRSVAGAPFACTDIVVDNSFDDATVDSCRSSDGDGVAYMEVPPQFLGHFQVCDDYLFVEAFAGSANLSYIVKQIGFQVVPIDHPGNKHHPKCKLLLLDHRQDSAWNYLHYLKNNVLVLAWHFAPPGGTASKARNIPMENGPPPLRDENNVEGFDRLTGKVLERVLAANLLYKHTSDFCVDLDSANHIFSGENPTGSWMWEIPCFSRLIDLGVFIDCEVCAFGGARRKRTSFLVNDERFEALAKMCPGESDDHQHEPWGLDDNNEFNTAKEAEYPIGMCQAYAQVLTAIANEKGISLTASPMDHSIRPYGYFCERTLLSL